jgi:ABC-type bacteriocin/lantibiotic exporter with double-glycine peptidase domain
MRIELNTPALLFPAISFLLLPYTNRYLALANLIRNLLQEQLSNPNERLIGQIRVLRRRIQLIRLMQTFAVAAMLLSMLCMLTIFLEWEGVGYTLFFLALVMMIISLAISLWEIQLSTHALNLQLELLEDSEQPRRAGRP